MKQFLRILVLVMVLVAAGAALVTPMPLMAAGIEPTAETAAPPSNVGKRFEPYPIQDLIKTTDSSGRQVYCTSVAGAPQGALLGRIVPCLIKTVGSAATRFSKEMIDALQPLLYAFLTFVIIMFGVRMLQNEPQIHTHGIVLLIKVAFVLGILELIPYSLVPLSYDILDDAVSIVARALINSGSFNCAVTGGGVAPNIWSVMDCVLGKLWGFTMGTGGKPGMLLATSAFGLVTGFLFSGVWGTAVFFGILGVLLSLFLLVVRVVLAFVNGYLVICLMFIMAPLLLPLIFLKQTASYGEKIWKNILAAFLMPVMVTAYSVLALMLYDAALFDDRSLLNRIFDQDIVEGALEGATKMCDQQRMVEATPQFAEDDTLGVTITKTFAQRVMFQPGVQVTGGANDPCANMQAYRFNINQATDTRFQKGKATFNQIFTDLVTLLLIAFLLHKGLGTLDSILRLLTGAGAAVAPMHANSQMEAKLQNSMSEFRSNLENYKGNSGDLPLSGQRGQDFARNMPGAIGAGVQGFLGSMKRR